MIGYVRGIVTHLFKESCYVDVHGVGYKIFMPEGAIQNLEVDSEVKIYTFMRVREDDVSLYGFLNVEELAMFELLISVGGIGAKSAVGILSNIAPSKFALAVITDDVTTLKKLPGIGAKTAQRIILELKDKIKTQEATEQENEIKQKIEVSDSAKDAIEALQVLGYTRREVEEAISKIGESNLTTEEIIKRELKYLER